MCVCLFNNCGSLLPLCRAAGTAMDRDYYFLSNAKLR